MGSHLILRERSLTRCITFLVNMALVSTFVCGKCGEYVTEVVTSERVCVRCRTIEAKAKKAAHRAYLNALPLEDRIKLIEDALYDLNAENRIARIESIHATY